MSRKIKYRVWDEEKKKYCTEYNAMTLKHDGEFCIERGWCTISGGFKVEQSTLLKDKNGKEIYEGDIVFFFTEHFDKATGGFDGEDEHNATVEWFDNGFAFMDKVPYDPNIECEVIGNIHENPELLGGEE